jgi:hypothetical protein
VWDGVVAKGGVVLEIRLARPTEDFEKIMSRPLQMANPPSKELGADDYLSSAARFQLVAAACWPLRTVEQEGRVVFVSSSCRSSAREPGGPCRRYSRIPPRLSTTTGRAQDIDPERRVLRGEFDRRWVYRADLTQCLRRA